MNNDEQQGNLQVKTRIVITGLLLGLVSISVSGYLASQYMAETKKQRLDNLKQTVQLAKNTIEPILVEYRAGQIPKEQALTQVRGLVRKMVYKDHHGKNYVFMSSYDGTMLVQPFDPEKELMYAAVGKGTIRLPEWSLF